MTTSFLNTNINSEGTQPSQEADTTSSPAQQDNATPNSQEQEVFLKVGDRVFKTQEDAINHITHAQNHISKLETDFASATSLVDKQAELLEKARKVDEVMEALAKRDSSGNGEETPGLSKDEVIADAIRAFEQRQQEARQQETVQKNWEEVTNTLTKAYGDKTDEVVQKVAAENGLSIEEAAQMAQRHPKVFLKMFDVKSQPATAKPNLSTVNAQYVASSPSQSEYRPLSKMSMKERAAEVERRIQELQSKQ